MEAQTNVVSFDEFRRRAAAGGQRFVEAQMTILERELIYVWLPKLSAEPLSILQLAVDHVLADFRRFLEDGMVSDGVFPEPPQGTEKQTLLLAMVASSHYIERSLELIKAVHNQEPGNAITRSMSPRQYNSVTVFSSALMSHYQGYVARTLEGGHTASPSPRM